MQTAVVRVTVHPVTSDGNPVFPTVKFKAGSQTTRFLRVKAFAADLANKSISHPEVSYVQCTNEAANNLSKLNDMIMRI